DAHFAPAYYEDTDLAFRVRRSGRKVLYQPFSSVVHFEGMTAGTDTTRGVKRHQVVNAGKFFDRWRTVLETQPRPGTPLEEAKDRGDGRRLLVIDARTPTPDQDS